MTNLAPIINSSETISADAAPSINRVFTKLHASFGFWPRVLTPYGGARTKADQAHLVATKQSDTMNSDHREDATGRAAVDIDNQEDFRHANQELFVNMLAAEGWHNITNEGEPFPTEPWHFAKHGIAPASDDSTLIINSNKKGNEDMEIYGSTSPNPVPAKYLALNAGLSANKPTYMWIPAGISPQITQDQNLITQMVTQQFGQPTTTGIVPISWTYFDQRFAQAVAATNK